METQERLAPSSWALGSSKQNGKVLLESAQVNKSLLVLVLSRGGGFYYIYFFRGHAVEVMATHECYLLRHLDVEDQTQAPPSLVASTLTY